MHLRTLLASATAALAAATCLTAAGPAAAHGPASVHGGRACSPAVSINGFSDALDETTYRGAYVGNLSALAGPAGRSDRGTIAALSDESFLFHLDARTLRPEGVTPLADESGTPIDSEGLVADRGSYLVSTETEPTVRRYSRTGKILDRLPVPEELSARSRSNGRFEGLTLLPGGRTLVASMEYPLTGDPDDVVRLQTWKRTAHGGFGLGAQYTYRVDQGLGVSEITATPDGRLLVLERGFTSGVGNTVRLYLADRHGTTYDKTLLTDLADCPSLGATSQQTQPNPLLDNIEGMMITGREHGRLKVLLVSDDNENPTQTTRFYALRVGL